MRLVMFGSLRVGLVVNLTLVLIARARRPLLNLVFMVFMEAQRRVTALIFVVRTRRPVVDLIFVMGSRRIRH